MWARTQDSKTFAPNRPRRVDKQGLAQEGIIELSMATRRAHPSLLLVVLIAGADCASTQVAEQPAPLPLPVEERTSNAEPTVAVGKTRDGDASSVLGAEGLVALCQSLRDEPLSTAGENPVEQARAAELHAQRRQAALAARYVAMVPAAGFAFTSYELGERRLLLDTEHGLALDDGAELVVPSKEATPGFVLAPELAERLISLRAQGKLALRLIFKPAGSQLRKDACLWLGGGRVVKMEIEILGSALLALDGSVLSRGDTGEYADTSPQLPVRSPKVSVRKTRFEDGRDIPAALSPGFEVLAERAKPCYERRLAARPALRGTLVVGVRIGAGSRVESPHVDMSSLGDEPLVTCVTTAVGKATIAGTSSGQRFSIPLQFGSAEER